MKDTTPTLAELQAMERAGGPINVEITRFVGERVPYEDVARLDDQSAVAVHNIYPWLSERHGGGRFRFRAMCPRSETVRPIEWERTVPAPRQPAPAVQAVPFAAPQPPPWASGAGQQQYGGGPYAPQQSYYQPPQPPPPYYPPQGWPSYYQSPPPPLPYYLPPSPPQSSSAESVTYMRRADEESFNRRLAEIDGKHERERDDLRRNAEKQMEELRAQLRENERRAADDVRERTIRDELGRLRELLAAPRSDGASTLAETIKAISESARSGGEQIATAARLAIDAAKDTAGKASRDPLTETLVQHLLTQGSSKGIGEMVTASTELMSSAMGMLAQAAMMRGTAGGGDDGGGAIQKAIDQVGQTMTSIGAALASAAGGDAGANGQSAGTSQPTLPASPAPSPPPAPRDLYSTRLRKLITDGVSAENLAKLWADRLYRAWFWQEDGLVEMAREAVRDPATAAVLLGDAAETYRQSFAAALPAALAAVGFDAELTAKIRGDAQPAPSIQ